MTTRFSLAELSEMLKAPVSAVRQAVDTLAEEGKLTAESFVYADRNWRVAPSDTKRVQEWIEAEQKAGRLQTDSGRRVVRRKVVSADTDSSVEP